MVSKEAQAIIDSLRAGKKAGFEARRAVAESGQNPLLAEIEGIYRQRREGDENARNRPLPDGLTLSYTNADGVPGEWLRTLPIDPGKLPERAILFLHGGGFTTGSALSRRFMAAGIAHHAKVDSFAINYRKCPEYRFPAHLMDCVTAFLWLVKEGYRPEHITVIGESAGANLAVCLPLFLRDRGLPVPGGVCAVSPVVDLDGRYDSRVLRANRDPMIGEFFDEDRLEDILREFKTASAQPDLSLYCTPEECKSPYASPIHGDFTGFPRLMIQVGTEEILYDDSIELEKKAREAGVDVKLHIWPELFHCFSLFDMPEGDEVRREIAAFVRGE